MRLAALRQDSSSTETLPSLSKDALERLIADPVAPDSQPSQQARTVCVLGIDPDIGGAVAVMSWNLLYDSPDLQLEQARVVIHDMPVTSVSIGKKLRR